MANILDTLMKKISSISDVESDCLADTIKSIEEAICSENVEFFCNGNICIINKKTCVSIYKHDAVNSRVEIDCRQIGVIDVSYNQAKALCSTMRYRYEQEIKKHL